VSTIRLLPRHGLNLEVRAGDGPRFARLFLATWRRLRLSTRRRLLGYWRDGEFSWRFGHVGEVLLIPAADYREGDDKTSAETYHFGYRYLFRADHVDAMPEDIVQDLVAHELAHGIQAAAGIRCIRQHDDGSADFIDRNGVFWGGLFELELDADDTMRDWGFDPESIDRWSLATGRTKVIEFHDPMEGLKASFERMYRTGR
jgi:hypothetical protein